METAGDPVADGGGGPAPPGDPAFEEVQRFRERPTMAGAVAISVLSLLGILAARPGPAGTAVLTAVAVGVPLWVAVATLRTEVRPDGVRVGISPLHLRSRVVPFEDVAGVQRVEVRALRDYGGVGVRRDADSWAYLVGSGGAVRLERADRPDVVLGSARADELQRAVEANWRSGR